MAEPLFICPADWYRGTLEPSATSGLILSADSGGTPSTSVDEYWDGEVPWLTPKEVTRLGDGLFVSTTERMITEEGLAASAARLMPAGTVMLTKRAPVGAVAVNAVPMATNQGFLNFRCGPRLRPLYFAYWLKANRPYLDAVANGSTYAELYVSELFEFEIAVPPVATQDRIVNLLGALQFVSLLGLPLEQSMSDPTLMIAVQDQSRRLSRIRDGLLPLLLSGAIDVSHCRSSFRMERSA